MQKGYIESNAGVLFGQDVAIKHIFRQFRYIKFLDRRCKKKCKLKNPAKKLETREGHPSIKTGFIKSR